MEPSEHPESHLKGFQKEIRSSAEASENDFFTWFNEAGDKESAFIRGAWDFSYHIATPTIPYIQKPESLTALEIGYGGGRLLASASRHFGVVAGVDIHDQSEKVDAELQRRGIHNHKLYTGAGRDIPMSNEEVDFVYSFIVFQHMEKLEILRSYLSEAYRVLRSGGVGVFYFGRYCRFSFHHQCRVRLWMDLFLEKVRLKGGYKEMEAEINHINLLLTRSFAISLLRENGFECLGTCLSRRKLPDGVAYYGGQHGVIVRKP